MIPESGLEPRLIERDKQRLGMMILLGQHGQRQDYEKGLEYIRLAAQTCDENAPQGAYVSRAMRIFQKRLSCAVAYVQFDNRSMECCLLENFRR